MGRRRPNSTYLWTRGSAPRLDGGSGTGQKVFNEQWVDNQEDQLLVLTNLRLLFQPILSGTVASSDYARGWFGFWKLPPVTQSLSAAMIDTESVKASVERKMFRVTPWVVTKNTQPVYEIRIPRISVKTQERLYVHYNRSYLSDNTLGLWIVNIVVGRYRSFYRSPDESPTVQGWTPPDPDLGANDSERISHLSDYPPDEWGDDEELPELWTPRSQLDEEMLPLPDHYRLSALSRSARPGGESPDGERGDGLSPPYPQRRRRRTPAPPPPPRGTVARTQAAQEQSYPGLYS